MQKESSAVLIRIFIGERISTGVNFTVSCQLSDGKNHYSGVTVPRGITGFGKASKIRSSDLLDISSDLPVVLRNCRPEEKIELLKKVFEETDMIGSSLITEEKENLRYERNNLNSSPLSRLLKSEYLLR